MTTPRQTPQKTGTLDDHAHAMALGMKLFLLPEYYRFRRSFRQALGLTGRESILDFGCGIGLLEELLEPFVKPEGCLVGVDIGANLLKRAARRRKWNPNVSFVGISPDGAFPFADHSFDLIVTNLVSHLLDRSQKQRVYREFGRVLKPGGRAVLAEIGKPYNLYGQWLKFLSVGVWGRLWPYEKNSADSYAGRVPDFLREAGFSTIVVRDRLKGFIEILDCTTNAPL
jgi:ubiquinone/menaquinone biosynthesis C-methylase UbiE